MRQITKGPEPIELTKWKKSNPRGRYQNLDEDEMGRLVRQAIRKFAITEQFGLCAYCCKQINETNSTNEHIVSQSYNQNKSLEYDNIVASCDLPNRCNQKRGSRQLSLTPLMIECETELSFKLSGKVEGRTERANQVINVLALDTTAIRQERKALVDSLIYVVVEKTSDLELLDDELIGVLLNDLKRPDQNGQLPPFSPVLINILKQFLNTPS